MLCNILIKFVTALKLLMFIKMCIQETIIKSVGRYASAIFPVENGLKRKDTIIATLQLFFRIQDKERVELDWTQ